MGDYKSTTDVEASFNKLALKYMADHQNSVLRYDATITSVIKEAALKGDLDMVKHGCIHHKPNIDVRFFKAILDENLEISKKKEVGKFLFEYMVRQMIEKGADGKYFIADELSVQQFQLLVDLKIFTDTEGEYVLNWLKESLNVDSDTYLKAKICLKTIYSGSRLMLRKIQRKISEFDENVAAEIGKSLNETRMSCPPEITAAEVLAYYAKHEGDEDNTYLLEEMIEGYCDEREQ